MNLQLSTQAKSILGTVAPLLATALGGPLAGTATKLLLDKFGGGTQDPKAVEAAITSGDPQTLVALQTLQTNFKQHMADLGVQEEQLRYQDVASARAREMAVKDWVPAVLATSITLGFFGVLTYVMHYGTKIGQGQGGEAVLLMLGSLSTAWTAIVGYYFGSSVGARQSALTLGEIAKQP